MLENKFKLLKNYILKVYNAMKCSTTCIVTGICKVILWKRNIISGKTKYPELLSLSTSLVLLTNTFLLITYPGIEQHNFLF